MQLRPDTPTPNFFIPGAPKCGTTAWVEYISTHRDITFGREKEPHLFNTDLPWMRKTTTEHYYESYKGLDDVPVRGDASVLYIYSDAAARLAASVSPDAKVLIFLREPAAFLRSYHNHMLYLGVETEEDFGAAWSLSDRRREGRKVPSGCPDSRLLDYPTLARFAPHVARWFEAFPQDNVRVVWMDEWSSNPRTLYLSIMDFLGLEDDGRMEFPRINQAPSARSKSFMRILRTVRDPVLSATAPIRAAVRKARGGRRLNIYGQLRGMNTRRGKAPPIPDALTADIREMLSDDRDAVAKLAGDPK